MTPTTFRRALGATAIAACIGGLAGCGGSSSSAAPPPSTTARATTTTTTGSSVAGQADALCAEIGAVNNDLHNVNLSKPQSVTSAIGTLTGDMQKLQTALNRVSSAGRQGSQSGPVHTLTADTKAALNQGKAALSDVAGAKLGAAQSAYHKAVNDLKAARNAGAQANLQHCSQSGS